MDLRELMDGSDHHWTDERHSLFLNWIEASFVRRMLGPVAAGDGDVSPCRSTDEGLRLDRHVPDSATESTADCRRRSPSLPPAPRVHPDRVCGSTPTRVTTRKRPDKVFDASLQYQVVPKIEIIGDCEGDEGN